MNDAEMLAFAKRVMKRAWADLPPADRGLLEAIRAEGRDAVARPLGAYADELRRSAGYASFPTAERNRQDAAAGLWIPELRLVLINIAHSSFQGLDRHSLEWAVARVAWHEWGHALAIHRATSEDVSRGLELLALAPPSMAENVRSADYRQREYTHEIVAEVYALLINRRRRGAIGRPPWLSTEIYELVRRVVGWNQ
ncbi:MAG TPA: hypothetical protein VHU86_02485 [Solirubrobacterales bacterium]|jgi:hypothetical protein|nr:hypothetical protein [Solirubrobacterales bacterium]